MRRFALNYGAVAEMVPLMRAEFELCRVQRDEVVAIHADYQTHPHYPAAALGAALSLGAYPFQIWTSAHQSGDEGAIHRAWEGASLIVDLRTTPSPGSTSLAAAALRAGRRVLAVAEPLDVLVRLFPDPAVVERTRAAGGRLADARRITVTSRAGTILHLSKEGRPGIDQHGFSESPGWWDRWPSSRVVCAPIEDSAEGRLVIGPGDAWLSLGRYAEHPVTLTFSGGRVTGVEGNGTDALLVRDWLARTPDPGARILSGFSWGCDPRARWERVAMRFADPGGVMEVASRDGAIMVIFGNNTSPMLGGQNATAASFAVALRDHTVDLDGAVLVRDGATRQ